LAEFARRHRRTNLGRLRQARCAVNRDHHAKWTKRLISAITVEVKFLGFHNVMQHRAYFRGQNRSLVTRLHAEAFLFVARELWNYQASGVVSGYEAGAEATNPSAIASEYVTELLAKAEAGDSAFPRFLKSSAGPV
jgi:hypothetical protein